MRAVVVVVVVMLELRSVSLGYFVFSHTIVV